MFVIRVIYTLKLIFIPEEISPGIEATLSDYINRMTGPYWWSFTSQYFGPFLFIIPFLFRKLRYKTRWIFLSIISMCFGAWFERFIITITSIHRDLITESSANQSFWLKVFSPITIEKVIIGLVYASLIFFISEYYKDQKNQHEVLDN